MALRLDAHAPRTPTHTGDCDESGEHRYGIRDQSEPEQEVLHSKTLADSPLRGSTARLTTTLEQFHCARGADAGRTWRPLALPDTSANAQERLRARPAVRPASAAQERACAPLRSMPHRDRSGRWCCFSPGRNSRSCNSIQWTASNCASSASSIHRPTVASSV